MTMAMKRQSALLASVLTMGLTFVGQPVSVARAADGSEEDLGAAPSDVDGRRGWVGDAPCAESGGEAGQGSA